ncbi:MAG: ABC transporter permease [Acidobacteria bacterium]|nr:MAG: ABC transporter permease [Acidobacteriota bacterium]
MIPVKYNFRSLVVRRVGTMMTIGGVALTVGIFVSILAMVNGLENTYVNSGEPLNLVLLRKGSQTETNSYYSRSFKGIVETMNGVQAVSGEILVIINHPRLTGESANLIVRGISDKTFELRPKIKLVEGRMLKTGLREVLVSRSVSNRFKDGTIGDTIHIGRTGWKVVGIFDASRTPYDSEIWGDYGDVAQEFDRPIYSSVLVRCADEGSLKEEMDAPRETEYFESQVGTAAPMKVLGYVVGIIMAIGSCFAVMNTMYAATAYRTREIATLRVLGFRRRNILLSFMLESLLLALIGGALGCLMALPMNGISTGTANFLTFSEIVFQFRVTPRLMLIGLMFSAVVGTLGGFLPARLAARIPIVRALRTEV